MKLPGVTASRKIAIKGRVQGVGFRPFIFRLAKRSGLAGWVQNTNEGVTVFIEGKPNEIDRFISDLKNCSPVAAFISEMQAEDSVPEGLSHFEIRHSQNNSSKITEISPDIAVCTECLADMKMQPHRIDYPLINCTNCGPRFTIIRDLPYDRANTTMSVFPMCRECEEEYNQVLDRRFHAQPVACNNCGPVYELWDSTGLICTSFDGIIGTAVRKIREGGIIAVKGVGGFHLICDAGNQDAVTVLRKRKGRETKPLAVLFRDLESAACYVSISSEEERLLCSWRRPIVLLKCRSDHHGGLATGLNEGLMTLGIVLPYMPFHYLLMERLELPAIVLTSGNLSDQPIIIENTLAVNQFNGIADLVITHQREIYNRADDSVVRQIGAGMQIVRRARGFCPDPVPVGQPVDGILAMGAELTNSFCIGKGENAYLSQYIGDLKNPYTQEHYRNTIDRFLRLFRVKPRMIVTDLHPEYYSTKAGWELKNESGMTGKPLILIPVQHHHAHIAACMAEHGIDERVIGVAFDGTGLGTDGHIWGSEIMVADLENFERISHFEYLPMPGGDKAVAEPWRMAFSVLYYVFGESALGLELPFMNMISEKQREWTFHMIRNQVNTPLTCGAGRYFDAVAALLGICLRSGYEGEGPMKLEALAREGIQDEYPVVTGEVISLRNAFRIIGEEIRNGKPLWHIATAFHNTIATAIVQSAVTAARVNGLNKVVLSGGVFQNRFLTEQLVSRLNKEKIHVYLHAAVPSNDGGIALGQIVIAAKREKKHSSG